MSHVAKIDLTIDDLDCLEKACAECGLVGGSKDCNKLLNSYSKEVIIKKATELGYVYDWEKDEENDEITITINDYS